MDEKYRIHQVITAAPGTRIMTRWHEEGEPPDWRAGPVVLFGLVEDLEAKGERFVVPLMQWPAGVFVTVLDTSTYGEVLAPGEEPDEHLLKHGAR